MNEFYQGPITSLGEMVGTFVINVEQCKKKKQKEPMINVVN